MTDSQGSGYCVKTVHQEGIQAAERDTRTTIGIPGIV